MKYLTNDRNIVRDADLSATNIVPSRVYYRTDEVEKQGGGTVSLSGDFTGDADTVVEVEVLDENGSLRNVSQPTFVGTGNGLMSGVTADLSVDPQQVTVTLVDLGTETRSALTPFQGAVIVARDPGAAGNDITINIDPTGVVGVLSPDYRYSLQAPLQAGVNEYTGVHLWNWNTPYLNADGTIPVESPRIRFGDDPQVYRPYKKPGVNNVDVFGFSPAPVRDVDEGTPVLLVSGSYVITVSDGVTDEVLPPVVTLYDALQALTASTLVTVQGVVVNDQQPGGQGVTDLSVRTTPYAARILRDGTTYVEKADIGFIAGAAAPTETLRIVCEDVSLAGAERWSVQGDVSESLPEAITNVLYSGGAYQFLIPMPASAGTIDSTDKISVRFKRPVGGGTLPNFKAFMPRIGIGAKNGTWVFEYQERLVFCDEEGQVTGSPNPDCLGTIPEGVDPMTGAELLRRRQKLLDFNHEFAKANTSVPPVGSTETITTIINGLQTITRMSSVAEQDIIFAKNVVTILSSTLQSLTGEGAETDSDFDSWAASTVTAKDAAVAVIAGGKLTVFRANVAGTTNTTAPTWPTTKGATVTDGGVTWENVGYAPLVMWDDLFQLFQDDVAKLMGNGQEDQFGDWIASTAYPVNKRIRAFVHEVDGPGYYGIFKATTGGTSSSTAPVWPSTISGTIADGTVTWTFMGHVDVLYPNTLESETDTQKSITRIAPPSAVYLERYETGRRAILNAAGIDPFDEAGTFIGDGCWQDFPEIERFFGCVSPDADYAPVFPGIYYHSSISETTETGVEHYRTTREFGFGPAIGCMDLLQLGDQIIVTIKNINGVSTYQQGDEIDVSVVRAEPIALNGGQTGSDTLTWSVSGTEAGALDPYEMTLTPPTYADGGITFDIARGPIPFALDDTFRFAVQAARAQWRQDGGAWSSPFAVGAPHSLADGLSAVFTEGASPSWVPGDRWTFRAEAVNGVDNLRSPTDPRAAWTGSTVIMVTPAEGAIAGLLLGGHTIPSDATITLTGSDDGFSTTPLSLTIPWRADCIWQAITAARAEYRLTINRGGSLNWLWSGDPLQVEIPNGIPEVGRLTKRLRLPGAARRVGLGVTVEHEAVTQASLDEFVAAISDACLNDDRRLGIVPNPVRPESGIVTVDAESLEVSDVRFFQPQDERHRLLAFSVELAPIP